MTEAKVFTKMHMRFKKYTCLHQIKKNIPLHPHQMPKPSQLASFHAKEQRFYSESLTD